MKDIRYLGKCLLIENAKKKILVVGDLHLGYEESLNNAGVFVSREMFNELILEMNEIFDNCENVDEVVLLGDVKHDFGKITKQEWNTVLKLFDYLLRKCKKIAVIRGNHDKIIAPIASKRENVFVEDFYIDEEIAFLHGDKDFEEIHDGKIKYWIIGHGHPAVKIREVKGVKIEKYKCFLAGGHKGKEIIIVPSFFSGSEGSDPRENGLKLAWKFNLEKFKVKIVGNDLSVLDFGELGKLR